MLSISGEVKPKCVRSTTCPGAALSSTNPTRIALEAKVVLGGHKPTTSSPDLRHGLSYYCGANV